MAPMADQVDDLTENDLEALKESMSERTEAVMSGVRSGALACQRCGRQARLDKAADGSWTADCTCGWEAAGIGSGFTNPN
jgi:hypothetical protein